MSLICTPEQEAEINALLPSHIQVRAIGGTLGDDILSEIGPGGLYERAGSLISSLPSNAPENA